MSEPTNKITPIKARIKNEFFSPLKNYNLILLINLTSESNTGKDHTDENNNTIIIVSILATVPVQSE